MKARHSAEREAKEEGVCKMPEDGLLGSLHSELAEVGSVDLHLLHKDPAEKSGNAENEAVPIPVDRDRSANSVNDEANQVMRTGTSKNVLLSAENPTLQTDAGANEESTPPAREEQHRRPNSSFPASQQYDPLHREYKRMGRELNQLSRKYVETVLQLKSERDKEIDGIRRKYEAMVKESEAASLQKMRELENWKFKLMMSMKLAEAVRSKYSNLTTAPSQQVASHIARTNLLQEQASAAEELLTNGGVICLSDDE